MKGENRNIDDLDSKISIRNKKRYFKVDKFAKFSLFLIIAIVSGSLAGKYTSEKMFSENFMEEDTLESNKNDYVTDLADSVNKVASSLVTISNQDGCLTNNSDSLDNITGVVIDKRGYIITNYSKIKDYNNIFVKLPSVASTPMKARYVGAEKSIDIAMIKIDCDMIEPIKVHEDDDFREGDIVLAVGNSICDDYIGIVTPGIVTSMNDSITDEESDRVSIMIQTNAIINKDNTGGVLINDKGEVIGFNSLYLSNKFDKKGLYYSVGARAIKDIIDDLIGLTDILGIDGGSILDTEGTGISGVYINEIKQNGYAAESGMKPSDIIISMDNQKIKTLEDIFCYLKDKKSGDTINCGILRDGKVINIDISID